MKFFKRHTGVIIFSLLLVIIPLISFADIINNCDPKTGGKICNPIRYDTINGFIKALLEGVLKIGIPIVTLAMIYVGFMFVAARGNSEKLTKAKEALLYTVIGAAILLGSWGLAQLISNTVGALK